MDKTLKNITKRFSKLRIGVVGDVLADLYITGITDRVSREAPIIIVRQTSQDLIPGGAANVAKNIAAFGPKVELVGLIGSDELGRELKQTLKKSKVSVTALIAASNFRTVSKTRILAGAEHTLAQQVLRIDHEPTDGPAKTLMAV